MIAFTSFEVYSSLPEAEKVNYKAAKGYTMQNAAYLKFNAVYVNASKELQQMDSVNTYYYNDLDRARTMSADLIQ